MRIKSVISPATNKKLAPQRKKRLNLALDFFKQNKLDPQTGQLVSKKKFETNICRAKDIK